jgi:hypothetical protein
MKLPGQGKVHKNGFHLLAGRFLGVPQPKTWQYSLVRRIYRNKLTGETHKLTDELAMGRMDKHNKYPPENPLRQKRRFHHEF